MCSYPQAIKLAEITFLLSGHPFFTSSILLQTLLHVELDYYCNGQLFHGWLGI